MVILRLASVSMRRSIPLRLSTAPATAATLDCIAALAAPKMWKFRILSGLHLHLFLAFEIVFHCCFHQLFLHGLQDLLGTAFVGALRLLGVAVGGS